MYFNNNNNNNIFLIIKYIFNNSHNYLKIYNKIRYIIIKDE